MNRVKVKHNVIFLLTDPLFVNYNIYIKLENNQVSDKNFKVCYFWKNWSKII